MNTAKKEIAIVQPSAEPIKALVFYNTAKTWLEKASRIDEVQAIRNKAEAVRAYAMQALDRELQANAADIRMRAERKVGELLREMEKHPGGGVAGKHRSKGSTGAPPTLAELGISKDQSMRW